MHTQSGTIDTDMPRQAWRQNFTKVALAGVAAMSLLLAVTTDASAQDMSNGADTFYTSDKVTVQKVTFKNQI